ncbi:MAG: PA14 domain-containing protein [Verrucomicrobiota bacterium]
MDFNTAGEYTGNFSVWDDTGGANGGVYAFEENPTNGVNGSGGVSVYQSTDTTATYATGSWNFATNGAAITLSTMVYAAGGASGDKIQLGLLNSTTNGLNSNSGVAFESFRFIPASATSWTAYEQYRAGNVTTTSAGLGNVTVAAGHWYKFVVAMTNTSGGSGNVGAACALFDYGPNGITPGANLVTFSTVTVHPGLDIATNTAVWPALRITANAAVNAWDNFLVYQPNSLPVFTLKLSSTNLSLGSTATFDAIADGPGTISYAWFTNDVLAAGSTSPTFTIPFVGAGLTNVAVVARNDHGSVTNTATIGMVTPILLTGFNRDLVIESNSVPPYGSYAMEFNPGEGTCYYQKGLPGTTYGLPATGAFNSVIDGTLFHFQPYSGSNALVMSSDTGISSGALTLVTPATFSVISILANSASATPTSTGSLTLNFADGSTFATNFNAADWFFNPGFALQGVDRINISTGATDGGPTDPRFYQTTINLAVALGATNKPIASLTFGQAPDAAATAVYAVSGSLSAANVFTLAVVTNLPATAVQPTSATLNGTVLSSGGFAPAITIYYGMANGGTNAGSWAYRTTLGTQTGPFSQSVSGLSPNTTYYYTANAVNYAGGYWALPVQSFTTSAPELAQVTNTAATAVGASFATLNGQVLSTGGSPTGVILYYGTTNGGTNAGAWSQRVSLGAQTGAFAQSISGLSSNTVYYFTAEATNVAGVAWAGPAQTFTTAATNPVSTLVSVLTYHNDNTRWGVNSQETILTPANVNTNSFGKLFSYALDGFVYAQPLIVPNVSIPGKGTHNLVIVATEHNSVYAFDADSNLGGNSAPLWQASFINPAAGITTVPNGDVGTADITPEIGITSTPVIDPVTGTIYLEVKTKEPGPVYIHRIHALDITTGLERANYGSPSVISCTNYVGSGSGDNDGQNPPHVLWNGLREHSRPALTLLNGIVYMSFASHGDNTPYHGWMFGYNATNLSRFATVYNATPNGTEGGFWDGGGGPSVDAQGNLYFQTGNGTFDGGTTLSTSSDYAMSLLKLSTSNGLELVDYFAPSNAVALSGGDQDLGSAAPIILPDSAGSVAHPHLVVGGGKTAPIYLVDRDNMGRFNGTSGNNRIVQEFNGGPGGDRDITPAFFNNTLYIIDGNSRIGAYTISNALFNTTPVETPDSYANKGGATPCISANGTNNGIAWVLSNDGSDSPATPCVLRAYVATKLTQELYASDQSLSRDAAGDAVKFTVPTIANGKVYVGAQYSLTVYGLASSFVNTPVISPNGGIFTNSVTVTLSDATVGASIYYTLDGSTPTTNSISYTDPFTLTNTAAVTADAFKPGAVPSGTASASFLNSSAVGSGTGLLGQYWANTTSAAFIAPGFDAPPTLVRVDPTINFNWDTTTPSTNIGPDTYVAEWTGSVEPQFNDTYTFSVTADDGVRLWVNGQLLVDEWVDEAPTTWSGTIALTAQQRYNIQMDYYQDGGGAVAQLFWSSPLQGPMTITPESQLYPVTNPPPSVAMAAPANGAGYTATASVTLAADAAALYNPISSVAFYANGGFLGSVSNLPYALTATGIAAGSYALTAVATDGSGLSSTSAPVDITVAAGTGQPYGLTANPPVQPFLNMPTTISGDVPALLSGTGAFSDTTNRSPAAGLIPYAPNEPQWKDNAVSSWFMALPNSGGLITPGEQIQFQPTNSWMFPAGSVFVKNFDLVVNETNAAVPARRLETELLVRDINGSVYGANYKWRPDNSDADLLPGNESEDIVITNATGVRTQTWYYAGPVDCQECHNSPVANNALGIEVLGINERQLNGTQTYPATGVTDNQLRTLNRLGLLNPAINEAAIGGFSKLSAMTNLSASVQDRVRSYLDANCEECHQPGGQGITWDARYDTPLAQQNITNYPAAFSLGISDHACVVKGKDIWRSVLLDRVNTLDQDIQMPDFRNLIDTNAVEVIIDWINSLPGLPALAPPVIAPDGGSYPGSVKVTLSAPATNAMIYYTLDGTLPTTNSFPYSGEFDLFTNATVSASAAEAGFYNSVAVNASFLVQPLYFTSVNFLPDEQLQLDFTAVAGGNYVLEATTNFITWTLISTNAALTSQLFLIDPSATNYPYRFYRVLQQ